MANNQGSGRDMPSAPSAGPGGYPNQHNPYQQYQAAPPYPYGAQGGLPPMAGGPLGPPPPYMAQGPPAGYPGAPMGNQPIGAPPPYGAPYQTGPQQTVFMPTGFDSGARFDGHARAGVPPPPPGIAPNAAQMAMMQGQNVMLGQKKESFLTGGKGGGYTFW